MDDLWIQHVNSIAKKRFILENKDQKQLLNHHES